MQRVQPLLLFFLLCAVVFTLSRCVEEKRVPDYVARVGNLYLTRAELTAALASMPEGVDSTEAQKQIVEQWVANKLLYLEAQRLGLSNDSSVKRLLEESEQSVLVSALLSKIYDEHPADAQASELSAYYEQHKEHLKLREPLVRIRYLSHPNPDSIQVARRLLQQTTSTQADSIWKLIVARFASDKEGSLALSSTFYPESRLFADAPPVQEAMTNLLPEQISRIVQYDSLFHLIQVAERAPAGSIPRIEWVQDELLRRLAISERKQMYAREVQRLRNEALAREELEVPE